MAKRIVECFESDFVDGVAFDSEVEMKNFDALINDKNYYLECCKKHIENYYDYLCDTREDMISDIVFLDNGKIIVEFYNITFSEYIIEYIIDNYLYDTHFSELTDDIINDDFDDICENIGEYVVEKIKEFADDINKLVQIEFRQY